MANKRHVKLLKRGAKAIRAANTVLLDVTRGDLNRAGRSRVDRSFANVEDANLTGDNLRNANLTYSKLANAQLACTSLAHAKLTDTDFSHALILHIDFSGEQFGIAKFANALLYSLFCLY